MDWYADKVNDEDGGKDGGEATEAMADAALQKSTELIQQLASLQLWDSDDLSDVGTMTGMVTPSTSWPLRDLGDDLSEAGSGSADRQQEMAAIWRCLRDLEQRLDRGETPRSALGAACGVLGAQRSHESSGFLLNQETFMDGLTTMGSLRSPGAANSLNNTWTSLRCSSIASTPPLSPRASLHGRGATSTGSLAKTARAATSFGQRCLQGAPLSPSRTPSSPDVGRTPSSAALTVVSPTRQVACHTVRTNPAVWQQLVAQPAMLAQVRGQLEARLRMPSKESSMQSRSAAKLSL